MRKPSIPKGRGIHLREDEKPLTSCVVYDTEEFAAALRLRRRELGYTQETAAKLCMHSTRAVGDIERGKPTVEIGVVIDYAAALGVDLVLHVRGR